MTVVIYEDTPIEILQEMELRYTYKRRFTYDFISLRTVLRMQRSYNSAPNSSRGPSGSANCCGTSQSSCYGDHYSFDEGDMSTKKLLYPGTPFIQL